MQNLYSFFNLSEILFKWHCLLLYINENIISKPFLLLKNDANFEDKTG